MSNNGLPFTPHTEQTAIAIAYRNDEYIADLICPYVPVGKDTFEFFVYDPKQTFTVHDTRVGRKSAPRQVEYSVKTESATCEDHGLVDVIPQKDIDNAPPGYDPLNHAAESLTEDMALARESRVAQLYANEGNYATSLDLVALNKTLDDPNLDIIKFLLAQLRVPLKRPNTLVMSEDVELAILTHPKVVQAYHGTSGKEGMADWEWLKRKLKIKNVYVSTARLDTAKEGKDMTLGNIFSDFLSAVYLDPLATTKNRRLTFAMSARVGNKISGRRDAAVGVRGGTEVMVGEVVVELVIAPGCGILLQNAIGYTAPAS